MSFYVSLRSNCDYPGNQISNFTNILDSPLFISINDYYEVALINITYPITLNLNIGNLILTSKVKGAQLVENPKISTEELLNVQNLIYSSFEHSMNDLNEFQKYMEENLENNDSETIDNVYKKGYQILLGIYRSFSNLTIKFQLELLLTLRLTKKLFNNKNEETYTTKIKAESHNYTSVAHMNMSQISIYIKKLISLEKLDLPEIVEKKTILIKDRSI
jgi:hypothetical protein